MATRPTVALFRAAEDAQASAETLAARGMACVFAPVVETRGLAAEIPQGGFDFAVATSAKVFAFADGVARALPLYVVGEKTARAAEASGFRLAAPAAPDVAALTPVLPEGRALYLAGADRKPTLETALGERVFVAILYEARALSGWDESTAGRVAGAAAALHYSERSAELAVRFVEAAGIATAFRRLPQVCLSRAVAQRLAAFGAPRALWPARPVEADLFEALETALSE